MLTDRDYIVSACAYFQERERDAVLSRMMQQSRRVYADNNASTELDPTVRATLQSALQMYANASAGHEEGRRAAERLQRCRRDIALIVDPERADPASIVFTAGGSEANNMALHNVAARAGPSDVILVSAFEHHSVLYTAMATGREVKSIRVTADGYVDLEHFAELLRTYAGNIALVSVMLAQNEVGTVQPVQTMIEMVRDASRGTVAPVFHVDATQAFGKIPFTVESLHRPDLITASAHKFHGPKGIGFLYARRGVLDPHYALMRGGGQESGQRPGTENVPGIIAMTEALRLAADVDQRDPQKRSRAVWNEGKMRTLTSEIVRRVRASVPSTVFNNGDVSRMIDDPNNVYPTLPNTLSVTIRGVPDLAKRLDSLGIAASSASACARGLPSHVLTAMGRRPDFVACTARISVSRFSTNADAERIAQALIKIAAEQQQRQQPQEERQ